MAITVYGAGAIGGTTGAALARAGHDVLLVDRAAPHVEAINAHGITIERRDGATTTRVPAVTPAGLGRDLALLFATAVVDAHVYEVVERSPGVKDALVSIVGEGIAVADKAGVRVLAFDEFDPAWYRAALAGDVAARDHAMAAIAAHYRQHTKTKTGIWRDLAVRKPKTELAGHLRMPPPTREAARGTLPPTRRLAALIRD